MKASRRSVRRRAHADSLNHSMLTYQAARNVTTNMYTNRTIHAREPWPNMLTPEHASEMMWHHVPMFTLWVSRCCQVPVEDDDVASEEECNMGCWTMRC